MAQDRAAPARVSAGGDRVLTFDDTGDPLGFPVFLLHGTPGSRVGPKPRPSELYRLGIRLICYDRPGYGESTRQPGRQVAHAADDIGRIADFLKLDSFAVIGRSGGGPHALAAAAMLHGRVTRSAVLVSLAPLEDMALEWYAGMTEANIREYSTPHNDWLTTVERLRLQADRIRCDPESKVDLLETQMTDPDRHIVNDVTIRRLLAKTYQEAVRSGPYGWIDDVFALRQAWGFDLAKVSCPVLVWHGADDNFSPPAHARWLARRIEHADIRIQAQTAHFGAMEVLPEVLAWLADPKPDRDLAIRRATLDQAARQ